MLSGEAYKVRMKIRRRVSAARFCRLYAGRHWRRSLVLLSNAIVSLGRYSGKAQYFQEMIERRICTTRGEKCRILGKKSMNLSVFSSIFVNMKKLNEDDICVYAILYQNLCGFFGDAF